MEKKGLVNRPNRPLAQVFRQPCKTYCPFPKFLLCCKRNIVPNACSLPDEMILAITPAAGKLEVMFKQQKMYMGLKSFMVRSAKAIDRLLVILPLAHFFFVVFLNTLLPLGHAIRRFRATLCIF